MKTGVIDVGGGFRGIYACGVSTLSRDPADMKRLYDKGYADGEKVKSFMG